MQNSLAAVFFPILAVATASTRYIYPQRDGQAEWANTNTVHPQTITKNTAIPVVTGPKVKQTSREASDDQKYV